MALRSTLLGRLHPLTPQLLGHWRRWLRDGRYRHDEREKKRLRSLPRFQQGRSDLLAGGVTFADAESFLFMWGEIFEREMYRFDCSNPRPRFIDAGANIGLASLYLKHRFANAQIIAFEPDPTIAEILSNNLRQAGHNNVEIVHHALWSSETTLKFHSDGADGGHLLAESDVTLSEKSVQTTRLRPYLEQKVEFLKLDIEGAEVEVLSDCLDMLHNVERLFVEYHSFVGQPQQLTKLLSWLEAAGFRLHVQSSLNAPRPLESLLVYEGMDMQLNIFAFRPPSRSASG